MDELSMIRNLLAEPPPSPHVVAEGMERLFSAHAGAVPRTRPIRRAAFRSVLALGLTGAAAAAALAVATLILGAGSSPGGAGSVVIGGSARSVLLAAAVQAESAPTRGTYWRVRSMSRATLPRTFGHGENRYTLEQLSVTEKWTTHRGRNWLGRREWVRPKTPEDEAAWQRDGAPSLWCIGKTDTAPPTPICLHTAPGSASLTRFGPDTFQITEEQALTFGQLQRLPRDPDALRAWLIRINRRELDPSAGTDVVDLNVENELSNLLVDLPVPPGVRAAAFRALADMPNVTSIGPTQDELGRSGIGIVIQGMRGVVVLGDGNPVAGRAGTLTRTLIIDPKTSRVLADETTLGNRPEPATDRLILGVGWTNERPHKPGLPGSVSRPREPLSA
jgi:hypothetical protein